MMEEDDHSISTLAQRGWSSCDGAAVYEDEAMMGASPVLNLMSASPQLHDAMILESIAGICPRPTAADLTAAH